MKKPGAGSRALDVCGATRHGRVGHRGALCVLLASSLWLLAPPASAAPSQDDVFRSIQDNVARSGNEGGQGLALVLCAAGGLILLLLLGTRARQRAVPQPLNSQRKLLREVMRTVPLRRGELKQLRLLAEAADAGADGGAAAAEAVPSPLTLLLCPSVLARALKGRPAKVDRTVIARVVRKMGLAEAKAPG